MKQSTQQHIERFFLTLLFPTSSLESEEKELRFN